MFYIREQRNIIESLFPDAKEYNLILKSIGNFAEKEILPTAKKVQKEIFPGENIEKSVKQGIMTVPSPEEYDSLELPFPVYIAAQNGWARACANTALQISIQGMVCEVIRLFGDDQQKISF